MNIELIMFYILSALGALIFIYGLVMASKEGLSGNNSDLLSHVTIIVIGLLVSAGAVFFAPEDYFVSSDEVIRDERNYSY